MNKIKNINSFLIFMCSCYSITESVEVIYPVIIFKKTDTYQKDSIMKEQKEATCSD